MADIREELGIGREESGFTSSLLRLYGRFLAHRRAILFLAGVLMLGLYVGHLLYGKNSLLGMIALQDYARQLEEERSRLIDENAALQKEYFELKQLEGATE